MIVDITAEEKQVIIQLLSQVSLPVNQAPIVLAIIDKLKASQKPLDKK